MASLAESLVDFMDRNNEPLRGMLIEASAVYGISESAVLVHLLGELLPGHVHPVDLAVDVLLPDKPPYRPYLSTIACVGGRCLSLAGWVDLDTVKPRMLAATRKVIGNKGFPEEAEIRLSLEPSAPLDQPASQIARDAWTWLRSMRPTWVSAVEHAQLQAATRAPSVPIKPQRL